MRMPIESLSPVVQLGNGNQVHRESGTLLATIGKRHLPWILLALVVAAAAVVAGPTIGRTRHLRCVQAISGDVHGFSGSGSECSISVGPNGKYVYAADGNADTFMTYTRDEASGELAVVQTFERNWSDPRVPESVRLRDFSLSRGIAASPDGRYVYVGTGQDKALATFERGQGATLRYVEGVSQEGCHDGALACLVSPDGRHVYVSACWGNLCVLQRDPDTGSLVPVELLQDPEVGTPLAGTDSSKGVSVPEATIVEGISGPDGLAFSPDGRHLYVAASGSHAVSVFERNPVNGRLRQVQVVRRKNVGSDVLTFPRGIAVSPDGRHVYVCAIDDRLALFARDAGSGELNLVEVLRDGVDGVDGLDYAMSVCISPDGERVYVAAAQDNAISVFSRDAHTGRLTFLDAIKDARRLHRVCQLAMPRDGKHLYAVSKDAGLAVFEIRSGQN